MARLSNNESYANRKMFLNVNKSNSRESSQLQGRDKTVDCWESPEISVEVVDTNIENIHHQKRMENNYDNSSDFLEGLSD